MWWVTLPLAEEALGQVCRGVKALIECSKLQVHKVDDPNKQFVQFVMGLLGSPTADTLSRLATESPGLALP